MKEIKLTQGKFALVDDEDYEMLMQYKWHTQNGCRTNYAHRSYRENGISKTIPMHRLIMKDNSHNLIDHINGNGLDNRKENLRIVTKRQNAQNLHINKSSKYACVHFNKLSKKWRSNIRIGKERIHLGYFTNEEDAYKAYLNKLEEIGEVFVDNI